MVKCIQFIVNTAKGIKCSFLEQMQDEKLLDAQVIIGLSEIIIVSCLYMR